MTVRDGRVDLVDTDVRKTLADQCRHQLRLHRRWAAPFIPAIFVIGLAVSILGLVPSLGELADGGSAGASIVFAVFTALFGWGVALWLLAPLLIRPRIVPYFRRPLGDYDGPSMAAFRLGRGLYEHAVALEAIARERGVAPLSAYGFAYDYYEQKVEWHPAAEGLRTVDALRRGLESRGATPSAARDLEALDIALRDAAGQMVEFSLVVRLHATENMQGVLTREARQGSFW
jgi:hypothetical protein